MRSFALGVTIAAALLLGVARPLAVAAPMPVPIGDFLVCNGNGHLFVMSPKGKTVGTVPGTTGPYCPNGLALSADRRSAFFSILTGDETPPALDQIDLPTGKKHQTRKRPRPGAEPRRDDARVHCNGGVAERGLLHPDRARAPRSRLRRKPPACATHTTRGIAQALLAGRAAELVARRDEDRRLRR